MLEGFEAAIHGITVSGPAGQGFPITTLSKIVAAAREDARAFVARRCRMAASQPGHLQIAFVVARLYRMHFNDDALIEQVVEKARVLDAMEVLQSRLVVEDLSEPAERGLAREFWRSRESNDAARCDGCAEVLEFGDGYCVSGRRNWSLGIEIDFGEELLCQRCFNTHRANGT